MNMFTKTVLGACLVLIITVCAALIANKLCGNAQIGDFTEQKIYTLSGGTKKVLGKLNRKVTLKFFYTLTAARKLPEDARWLNNYYLYLKDLLSEYEKNGNGLINVEFIDPKPNSEEEEEAQTYNIRFYPGAKPLCLGLVAVTEFGKSKVLPTLHPMRQQFLEYEITKSIADLMEREKMTIGVISSLPILGDDMNPYMRAMMAQQGRPTQEAWGLIKYLRMTYDVNKIDVGDDATISDDVDYLMIIHPKNLDEKTLFAIDQYVMQGGNTMIFVDPFCSMDRPPQQRNSMGPPPQHDSSSNLNGLLKKWGVTMVTDRVVVDRKVAQKPNGRDAYPPFMRLVAADRQKKNGCFNAEHVVSAQLKEFVVFGAGKLTIDEAASGKITPVVMTTATGSTWKPSRMAEVGSFNVAKVLDETSNGTEPVTMACFINGPVQSNYPDGIEVEISDAKSPAADTVGDKKKSIKKRLSATKEAKEAKILVVADVDAISDMFTFQFDARNPSYFMTRSRNPELIESALDFLGGNSDLLSVRSRAQIMKGFEKYEEMDRIASEKTGEKEKEINDQLETFNEELRNLKVSSVEMLQNELTIKQKELNEKVSELNRERRKLLADKDKNKEALQGRLMWINILVAPGVLVLIAIFLGIYRFGRARNYIAKRQED